MENKKWKQFEKLTDQCYMNMIGAEKDEFLLGKSI